MESPQEEQDLSNLVFTKKWDKAMERLMTNKGKEEIRRDNPLHTACLSGAPFHLIKAMLEEYPASVRVADDDGCLPIHWACQSENNDGNGISPQVVGLLLDAYPEGATKKCDATDFLPLHHAAEGDAPLEVLSRLLDLYPEGAVTLAGGVRLPLDSYAQYASLENEEHVEKVKVLFEPILRDEEMCLMSPNYKGETPLDIAAKLKVLRLLTCVKTQHCHPEVIVTVARRFPDQLRARDEDGNYPLHLAAANQKLNGTQVSSLSGDSGANDENESGTAGGGGTAATDEADVKKDLIGELVKMYPEAAAAWNEESRFPLSLAIDSGKEWHEGVEAIADAAKHIVITKDEATNLYPFMLAATGDNPCLSTVYSLLRRCPELKRYLLD